MKKVKTIRRIVESICPHCGLKVKFTLFNREDKTYMCSHCGKLKKITR